ncbi:MAG: hypothetical protein K2K96_07275 [Lachnospiraceae bacterium]|nr:hypothetical protein [Lachnospiraceae bacterium]
MINKLKYALLPGRLRRKWNYDDYLYYRMQEMSIKDIDLLLTPIELDTAERQLNSDSIRHIFNSKRAFYVGFKEFIIRDVLFGYDYSFQDFKVFIDKHKKIIIKPNDMYAGIGIYLLELEGDVFKITPGSKNTSEVSLNTFTNGYESIQNVYDFCIDNHYCIEEYVTGHSSYQDIAPSSLNTIRVTTYINDEKKISILFIVNQFGYNGSIVDNNEDCCIWALTDIDTGVVTAVDIDARTGIIYDRHPDTGKDIVGFVNPHFDEVKKIAVCAAAKYKEARLIGWDIAIRSDGRIEIIEGNVNPELDLYQAISHKGLRGILNK